MDSIGRKGAQADLDFAKIGKVVPHLCICDSSGNPAYEQPGSPAWIGSSAGKRLFGIAVPPTDAVFSAAHCLCVLCISVGHEAKAPGLSSLGFPNDGCFLHRSCCQLLQFSLQGWWGPRQKHFTCSVYSTMYLGLSGTAAWTKLHDRTLNTSQFIEST